MKKISFCVFFYSMNVILVSGQNDKMKYSVKVWDSDFSMSSSILYHVTNDSLCVKEISTLEGGVDSFLTKRAIKPSECQMFIDFFSSTNLDTLKSEYINSRTRDGDRKIINILLNNREKKIEIANTYLPDIARLISLINQTVPSTLKISYKKK